MNVTKIESKLSKAKTASVPGETLDGSLVYLRYKAFNPPSLLQQLESKQIKDKGGNLNEFIGYLDRVWYSKAGDLIITVRVLNREDLSGRYSIGNYRSLNANKGTIEDIEVLSNERRISILSSLKKFTRYFARTESKSILDPKETK